VFQCFYIDQNRPVRWSIVVKGKPIVGFPLLGAFPSDHIPKATNQRMRQKFFSCSSSFKNIREFLMLLHIIDGRCRFGISVNRTDSTRPIRQ
jgi:hypothetical protein